MKLIDKLVKLANKEEIKPFILHGDKDVIYFEKNDHLYQKCDNDMDVVNWAIYQQWLNYEIEIIEDKKIEKLDLRGYYDKDIQDNNEWLTSEEILALKINEIIDKLNEAKDE